MLVTKYYLSDIRDYEDETGKSVLDLFQEISVSNLITLVMLGNRSVTEKQASTLIDVYLQEHSILEAYEQVKEKLLGKIDIDDENSIDLKEYESLTDIYTNMCMQIMALGVSYSEFWSMTTTDMYRVFDSIIIKIQNEINQQLAIGHRNAMMTGAAVWGKLEADPPSVDFGEKKDVPDVVYVEGYGELDKQSYNNLVALKSRRGIKRKGE